MESFFLKVDMSFLLRSRARTSVALVGLARSSSPQMQVLFRCKDSDFCSHRMGIPSV